MKSNVLGSNFGQKYLTLKYFGVITSLFDG